MRSTDYISKGTAVARLYKAREYLLMDKDCRKGLCFYLRSVDILDYLEEIGVWNLDTFSIEVLWAYEEDITYIPLEDYGKYYWYPVHRMYNLSRLGILEMEIDNQLKEEGYGEG